ncbi:MAG: sporulation protein YunB [Kyrpidia sp.]|nr:sporulation protein YunB [Kyrpidia sp.]
MRFGRRFGVRFGRRPASGRRSALIAGLAVLGFLTLVFYILDYNIRPVFVEIAKGMARRLATDAVNQAMVHTVQQGIDYSKFVTLHTDRNGRVIGATLNEQEVLRLQTDVTTRVQEVVDHLSTQRIDVPIGQAMNSSIFSAFGPMIPVAVIPFGTAESEVQQTVKQAGINQTITEVDIQVHAKVQILAPFVKEPVDIQTKVPVAYMVLVGDVPQYFFDARGFPFYPPGLVPGTPGTGGSGAAGSAGAPPSPGAVQAPGGPGASRTPDVPGSPDIPQAPGVPPASAMGRMVQKHYPVE